MPAKSKRKTTVLVLSVSAAAGHVRVAQALEAAIGWWYKDINVFNIDLSVSSDNT
jgi:hypothetical protein